MRLILRTPAGLRSEYVASGFRRRPSSALGHIGCIVYIIGNGPMALRVPKDLLRVSGSG